MNHFLHLLILLPALFNTIIALPAPVFDTSDSWADFPLENGGALLAATFGGVTDNPLTSPASIYSSPTQPDALPATPATPPIVQPLPIVKDQDWAKPMFLCCKSTSWLNDDEVKCTISMELYPMGPFRRVWLTPWL